MSQLKEKVLGELKLDELSARQNSLLTNLIINHTSTLLKWDYRHRQELWVCELRTKLKSKTPFTPQRAQKITDKVLKKLFKTQLFVPIEKIQNHHFCERPLVEPGENIFVVLNELPYYPTAINNQGQQFLTVISLQKNCISRAKTFFPACKHPQTERKS